MTNATTIYLLIGILDVIYLAMLATTNRRAAGT